MDKWCARGTFCESGLHQPGKSCSWVPTPPMSESKAGPLEKGTEQDIIWFRAREVVLWFGLGFASEMRVRLMRERGELFRGVLGKHELGGD